MRVTSYSANEIYKITAFILCTLFIRYFRILSLRTYFSNIRSSTLRFALSTLGLRGHSNNPWHSFFFHVPLVLFCRSPLPTHAIQQGQSPGVDFTKVLRADFMRKDPKRAKWHWLRDCHFCTFGIWALKSLAWNVNEVDTKSHIEGREVVKRSVRWKIFSHILDNISKCHATLGEGRSRHCHQITHREGRGSKISKKSVTYFLNSPSTILDLSYRYYSSPEPDILEASQTRNRLPRFGIPGLGFPRIGLPRFGLQGVNFIKNLF